MDSLTSPPKAGGAFSIDTECGELTHTLPMIVLAIFIAMTGLLMMFGEGNET